MNARFQDATVWGIRLAILALLAGAVLLHRQAVYTERDIVVSNGRLSHASRGSKRPRPVDGRLELHDKDGHLLLNGRMVGGRLSGNVDEWYPDGRRKSRFEYMDRSRTVEVYKWYPDGGLAKLYRLSAGPDGFTVSNHYFSFYEDGSQQVEFIEKGKSVHHLEWDASGEEVNDLRQPRKPRAPAFVVAEVFTLLGLNPDPQQEALPAGSPEDADDTDASDTD